MTALDTSLVTAFTEWLQQPDTVNGILNGQLELPPEFEELYVQLQGIIQSFMLNEHQELPPEWRDLFQVFEGIISPILNGQELPINLSLLMRLLQGLAPILNGQQELPAELGGLFQHLGPIINGQLELPPELTDFFLQIIGLLYPVCVSTHS